MTDHADFLLAIHRGDFETALPYSDWLQERDDKRGILLRRRYAVYRTRLRTWTVKVEEWRRQDTVLYGGQPRILNDILARLDRLEACKHDEERQSFLRYVTNRFCWEWGTIPSEAI